MLGRSVLTVPTYDVQYVRRLHLKALFLTVVPVAVPVVPVVPVAVPVVLVVSVVALVDACGTEVFGR